MIIHILFCLNILTANIERILIYLKLGLVNIEGSVLVQAKNCSQKVLRLVS